MSSPIEERLLKEAVPELLRPYVFGLNIGCGNRKIAASVGLDCKPSASAAHIIADARELPIASESLDYIISCHCLEHLRDGPLCVLREWIRCLKPGAPLALCVPDGSEEPEKALRYQVPAGKHIGGQHVHLFTAESLATYLRVAGLIDVETSVHDRLPYWKTKIILGYGRRGPHYQETPYRRRHWTWMLEVIRDMPREGIMPHYRRWRNGCIASKLFSG